jgi:hypothetical protein
MFTDNSISYVFVMAPLGMLIGCSLSRLDVKPAPAPAPVQPVTAAQVWAAAQLALAYRRPLALPSPQVADAAEEPCELPQGEAEGRESEPPAQNVPEGPPPSRAQAKAEAQVGGVE